MNDDKTIKDITNKCHTSDGKKLLKDFNKWLRKDRNKMKTPKLLIDRDTAETIAQNFRLTRNLKIEVAIKAVGYNKFEVV